MNYDEWLGSVPIGITGDPLWKVEAYRLALFVGELGWYDVTKLIKDKRTIELADQLYRALGSIGANISEGYSRGGGRDRAHFYEYALGSARESRGWHYHARHVLGQVVAEHRIRLLTQIVRLLLTMIPDQRPVTFREDSAPYRTNLDPADQQPLDREELNSLLQKTPLP
jgi:four helix bundle protein